MQARLKTMVVLLAAAGAGRLIVICFIGLAIRRRYLAVALSVSGNTAGIRIYAAGTEEQRLWVIIIVIVIIILKYYIVISIDATTVTIKLGSIPLN